MNKANLKRFKKIFDEQKKSLLFNDKIISEDYNLNNDDRFDEVDQAASDIEQSMRLRLRNREILYLKKINVALERIQDGTFGECESCSEDIEIRRLEARPTATLCVSCKEDEEKQEVLTAFGRKHKSLGETIGSRIF